MQGAITKRMLAIVEMAGMDVLCYDKTRTLTRNHLTIEKTLIKICWGIWCTHNKVTFDNHIIRSPLEAVFTACALMNY